MQNPPDYYGLLGVPPGASADHIRRAYHRQARLHHPDLHPSRPDAHHRMRVINQAYAILSNTNSRLAYDHSRASLSPSFRRPTFQYTIVFHHRRKQPSLISALLRTIHRCLWG